MGKKERASKSMDEFSVDLIINIFIRIPVKSLLKLRRVSKSWCNIIDDPFFTHMHHDFAEVQQRTLLLGTQDWPTDTFHALCDSTEEATVIDAARIPVAMFEPGCAYGSCKGLMYFIRNSDDYIVVSNPLRSQFMTLPPSPLEMCDCRNSDYAIGLGFDSVTKTFKMVTSCKTPYEYRTLVHTLGTTSWREVPSVRAAYHCHSDQKSVFLHGFLHWMTKPLKIQGCEGRILAFDVSKETFKVIPSPEIIFKENSEGLFRISDINGTLAMLDLSCWNTIDIWVMDYEKQLWFKDYTIDITMVGRIYNLSTEVVGQCKRDEILFSFVDRKSCGSIVSYWSYSMKTGDLDKWGDVWGSHLRIYSLEETLISIPGAV